MRKVSPAQLRAQERYDKANTRQIKLKLNVRTDADILEKLDTVENTQGYIKGLIREDLKGAAHEVRNHNGDAGQ